MKCITSPALDDTKIVSYVEGEADDAVVAHIKECPFCSERANQWTLLQNRLMKQLYRFSCPTSLELGDYHLGLLPASQKMIVAQHVRECPLCRQEVAELEDFLAGEVTNDGLLSTAKVLMARFVGNQGEAASAFAPLRGEAKGPLTFEADGIVIILDLQPTNEGKVNLLGQVAADDQDQWTGARAELQQADSPHLTAILDDLGSFRFEVMYTGSIQFTITSLSGVVIQSPDIKITP